MNGGCDHQNGIEFYAPARWERKATQKVGHTNSRVWRNKKYNNLSNHLKSCSPVGGRPSCIVQQLPGYAPKITGALAAGAPCCTLQQVECYMWPSVNGSVNAYRSNRQRIELQWNFQYGESNGAARSTTNGSTMNRLRMNRLQNRTSRMKSLLVNWITFRYI